MNYNTNKHSSARFAATMAILLTVLIALVALNLSDIGQQKTWDVEIPMTNTHITWIQTHHAGTWE